MTLPTELISLLADGEFHSGEDLGNSLGVSRAAIWKQISRLQALGLDLDIVKGRGYQLLGGLELLDVELIRRVMTERAIDLTPSLNLCWQLASTNDEALQKIADGHIPSGYVCLAEQQTSGRGRRGREWVSPFGSNIYLSLVWNFEGGVAAIEGLSLAIGIAVVRALSDLGFDGVRLKWPNDVLWDGRKLAGILIDIVGDASGLCSVVIGLGINVRIPEALGQAIQQPWVDLNSMAKFMSGKGNPKGVSRNALVGVLLNHLTDILQNYHLEGFALYRQEWEDNGAYLGCPVSLLAADKNINGIMQGLTNQGGLRLLVDGNEDIYLGGELSLRPLPCP